MGLQTPQQTPARRQAELAIAASPAQTGRFLKSPLAPYHSLMSLLSKIASKDEDKTGRGKGSMIYWDLFACAAGKEAFPNSCLHLIDHHIAIRCCDCAC
jgi:hypothetical protein